MRPCLAHALRALVLVAGGALGVWSFAASSPAASALASAPPPPLPTPGTLAPDPAAALAAPLRPWNVVDVDLDGDGRPEQAVLFGRADAAGVARVEGLLLLSRPPAEAGLRVEGAVRFRTPSAVAATFGGTADLDGDGTAELVIDERLAEEDVHRTVRVWWRWDRTRPGLAPLHLAELAWRDAGVPGRRGPLAVERTVTPRPAPEGGPPTLVETVERRTAPAPAPPERFSIEYRLDPTSGRYVAR